MFSREEIAIIQKASEETGWNYEYEESEQSHIFSCSSPEGQDINVEFTADTLDELTREVFDYTQEYDVSYETYLWLDDEGHGKNGAPYDMKDVYEDMAWVLKQAEKLLNALPD